MGTKGDSMKRYHRPDRVKDLRDVQGRITLASGEVTGHHHTVYADADTDTLPDAEFFEEPDGRRVLLALRPCVLRHQEHGTIDLVPSDAARGAAGERTAGGRLVGQYRQGDVLLHPISFGAWHVSRQVEYVRGNLRLIAD